MEHLASLMAEGKYDLAVAFDGDADRCLAVDEKGHVVNGDQMIAIFARQMKAEGPPARRCRRGDGDEQLRLFPVRTGAGHPRRDHQGGRPLCAGKYAQKRL